jgi:hypothetical protein
MTPSRPTPDQQPSPSPPLSPAHHLKMLVELLQPAGPDLARRWLAALLLVPRAERESIVAAVEARISELYPIGIEPPQVHVVHPPVQHNGFTEQVTTTYAPGAAWKVADVFRQKRAR